MRHKLSDILEDYPEVSGVHPACLAVPEISDDDFKALLESVERTGLRHDIILTQDGQLIDGRNRLIACYMAQKEPRFKKTSIDPWSVAFDENIARRHLTTYDKCKFADMWRGAVETAAKERLVESGKQFGKGAIGSGNTALPYSGQTRDILAERVGVGAKSIDKYKTIKEHAPDDVKEQLEAKRITLEEAYRKTKPIKDQKEEHPGDKPERPKPKPVPSDFVTIITAAGKESQIVKPKSVRFNSTNDSVDWANWTWNPVTGCEHGCKFCYAREIANSQRMAAYYPNKFEPTFHEYRLSAPKNMPRPSSEDARDGRVFVCSMADLFGKWVPDEWIRNVFDACLESPEWEYLFLTKWPARYATMPLLERAWYGASVIQQSDVARVEKAMQSFETNCIKWISLEPMLEPITFNDLSWCNLVVIGSQTATTQPDGFVPAFAPEFDWVVDVVNQCREFGVPYYLKENLGSSPGMKLPKPSPNT